MPVEGRDDAVRVMLLGPAALRGQQVTTFRPERAHQLLAVLAYYSGEWVGRDRLAAMFWPERSNSEARRNLRKVLFKATAVHGVALDTNDHALRWRVETDLHEFAVALAERRFADATDLYAGPALTGLDDPDHTAFSDWLAAERRELALRFQQAALERLRQLQGTEAADLARRLLQIDPLDEAAAAELIRAELELGRPAAAHRAYRTFADRLAEEVGVEPSQSLRQTLESTLPDARPDLRANRDTRPAFVGRRLELAEAGAMLTRPDCRLLSIVGPGGVGKSRFAQELLERSRSLHPGGAHWIALHDLGDVAQVVARIAQVAGFDINDRRDPIPQIAVALSRQRTLLVLDNAEHMAALATLVDELLHLAPALIVVVTSRARLNREHEWVQPLEGLAIPDEDSRDLDTASKFDAVTLFEQRARAAERSFELARHLQPTIDIVEAVAGLPLAIELAASWVRLLPPAEIARDIRGSLDVLERDPGSRMDLPRPDHVSVRAVVARSWELLGPFERRALADVVVFEGGFTRAAAQAVAWVPLPVLASLADRSLLACREDGCFDLHPLVARFAAEKLALDPAREAALRTRHAEHFARQLADLGPFIRKGPRRLVEAVGRDYANIIVAWRHATASSRADLVGVMVRPLQVFYELRGRLVEGSLELRRALELGDDGVTAARALARCRQALSLLLFRAGDLEQSILLAEAGFDGALACGERGAAVGCLLNLGSCLLARGDLQGSVEQSRHALELAREDGDRHMTAVALGNLGIAERRRGDLDAALTHYRTALAIERELANAHAVAIQLNNIGALLRVQRDSAAALRVLQEGAEHCSAHGLTQMQPYFSLNLGLMELDRGLLAAAGTHLQRARDLSRDTAQLELELSAELGLAHVEILQGDPGACGRLAHVASRARERQFKGLLVDTAFYVGLQEKAAGHVDRAAAILLTCAGHPAADASRRQRAAEQLQSLGLSADALRAASESAPELDALVDALLNDLPSRDGLAGLS